MAEPDNHVPVDGILDSGNHIFVNETPNTISATSVVVDNLHIDHRSAGLATVLLAAIFFAKVHGITKRKGPDDAGPRFVLTTALRLSDLFQLVQKAEQFHRAFWNRLISGLPPRPCARGNLDLPRRLRERQAEFLTEFF